jgi:cytochrome c-type biogenesis protein CcmH
VIAQLDGQRLKTGAGVATPPPAAAPAPTAAVPPATATPAPPAAAAAAALTGRIELDPKVASRVAPDDTVFVLARAAEGPRMPLAVQRFRAAELPRAFRLDDSMSMAPGMTISGTPRVIVEARVSKSGNAITQSGDVRGVSAPIAPGTVDLRVVIGDVVP